MTDSQIEGWEIINGRTGRAEILPEPNWRRLGERMRANEGVLGAELHLWVLEGVLGRGGHGVIFMEMWY